MAHTQSSRLDWRRQSPPVPVRLPLDEGAEGGVEPFTVDVPQADLVDLRDRIRRTRWPDQVADSGWDYGTELTYLKELCDYWADGYDWSRSEAELNRWSQYTTTVDGQLIHFIHARSPHADATPLLVTHGWPGSVFEFMKILGPLTDPVAHGGRPQDAFHVVCPSMPGYLFSGPTDQRGWDISRVALAEVQVMRASATSVSAPKAVTGALSCRYRWRRCAPND